MGKINLNDLKQPISYQWKTQSTKGTKAVCVAYIDARDVSDILDKVVGPENWEDAFYMDGSGQVVCQLSIWVDGRKITKSDVGSPSNIEATKGSYSDAFKRAAVKWGVGRFLYDLAEVQLNKKKHTNGKFYPATNSGQILWNKAELNEFINSKPKQKPKAKAAQPSAASIIKKINECLVFSDVEYLFRGLSVANKQDQRIIKACSAKKIILIPEKV